MKALSKVDFPALGRPAMETKPVRCGDGIRLRRLLGQPEWALLKHGPLPRADHWRPAPLLEFHHVPLPRPALAHGPAIRSPNRRRLWIRCLLRDETRAGHANGPDRGCQRQ